MKLLFSAVLSVAFLAGCSSGSSTSVTVLNGAFLDGFVSGVEYVTETQSGVTDINGTFSYREGETVTFSIGELTFPTTSAKNVVSPFDLAGSSSVNNNIVINIARLLQTLDIDGDLENGIAVSSEAALVAQPLNFDQSVEDFESSESLINLVANSGGANSTLVSVDDASRHLLDSLVANGITTELNRAEYTDKVAGNTGYFDVELGGSGVVVFYRADGVKLTRLSNGEIVVREWYRDDDGVICQTLNSSGNLDCLEDTEGFVAFQTGDLISMRIGSFFTFRSVEGNPENLVLP